MHPLHPWDVSPAEAIAVQERLARHLRLEPLPTPPQTVCGLDLSAEDAEGWAIGAAVVVAFPNLEVVEVRTARRQVTFPYIPGLLAFREVPVLVAALERLTITPDCFIVDGQGIAHPRRFGIACHIGLLVDRPTIGCAKSLLRGTHAPVADKAGAWEPLVDRGEVIGAAVRTRAGGAPVYVSPGHRIDLAGAVRIVVACSRGHRLPEPTRLAHLAAGGRLPERAPHTPWQERLL
ncbi:MAG: deoxyribonuclease V [Chloroflexota bacterium]|nr:deoxyribonuclease V [Chloroflexota bacterium]